MIGVDQRLVILDLKDSENKSKGGIFIPEQIVDKTILTGVVVSSYTGCELQEGDKVKYTKYAGVEVDDEFGVTHRVCKIHDILVKL